MTFEKGNSVVVKETNQKAQVVDTFNHEQGIDLLLDFENGEMGWVDSEDVEKE